MDNIQLNNNNDLFEQIEKKKKNIYNLYPNFQNSKTFDEITKDELVLEQKTKDFNKKLISLYGKHSSKFHSKKEDDSQKINDILHLDIKSIKDENINNNNDKNNNNNNQLSSRNPNNYKNMNLFRKKMAFRFRFMQNNSTKKKKLNKSFKSKNKKMNKILQISKSIPDLLNQEIKSLQNIKNMNLSHGNAKKLEEDNFIINKKFIKDYGFNSPFKGNRYIGNIYDYYKSNNCLNEKYLIFSPRQNDAFISEKINQICNENNSSIHNNKNNNKRNEKIKGAKIKKNEKSGMIHLNSLLK